MSTSNRTAVLFILGAATLPTLAQSTRTSEVSKPASSASGSDDNVGPHTPIEWFVAGVAVGIVIALAWSKLRGGGGGGHSKSTAAA